MTARCLQPVRICVTLALMMSIAAQGISVLAGQQGAPSENTLSLPGQKHPGTPSLRPPLPQPDASLEVPSLKLRSQPGYEQVTVTVTDTSNKYITDLKEEDFRIFEDGQQRPIGFFRIDRTAPVSVGIVVDCSSSMETKFAQARRAITRMVDDLDPRDDIFLESFSVEAQLLQPFTLDHREVIDHLNFLHALTQTSLYDAVYMGLYEIQRGKRDKRALVVVTDGMDNHSLMKREQVIGAARAMKVLIYTIGIGEETVKPGDEFAEIFTPDTAEVDMKTLSALSDETGARAFNLRRVGDGDELGRDCATISNELRQQYTLAYLSSDPGRLGYRTLRVETPKHPELSVRVRKGVAVIPR
jgi:Ca-activated chloride channel homolog